MRRISSLPTLQYCGKVDSIGVGIETTNALRSTIFHKRCETGEWDKELLRNLPNNDYEEISKWKVPRNIATEFGILKYEDSRKEEIVALDSKFNLVDVADDISQEALEKIPGIMIAGHLDMAWEVFEGHRTESAVVVCDIKSSIFAVKDRAESLQLHGYGIGLCKKLNASRYKTAIWDACDGKYYVSDRIIEIDSFECLEIQDRIRNAANNNSDFVRGEHCSGCWKRDSCPAHLVDVSTGNDSFDAVLGGKATESDIRKALIDCKSMGDLANKVSDACKSWVDRHGPVRSEDGRKCWTAALRNGRMALDQEAVANELGLPDLKKFMRPCNDYKVYDWRLIKEK